MIERKLLQVVNLTRKFRSNVSKKSLVTKANGMQASSVNL
jgi:hypothetical protein